MGTLQVRSSEAGICEGERIREGIRTSPSERSTVQGLIVHGRIIGEDVAVRVIVVPAGAMRAEKGEWLRRWG